MNKPKDWTTQVCNFSIAVGVALSFALAPFGAQAGNTTPSACNALVSVGNDLYLASPAGKVLAQFPSGGDNAEYVTISPDGTKVAYVVPDAVGDVSTYTVTNSQGGQNSFAIYPSSSGKFSDGMENDGEQGALEGMRWSADDVLRMTKHVSPTSSFFGFHRVNPDLTPPARVIAANFGDDCVLRRGSGGGVACEHSGGIKVGKKGIFYQSRFEGIAPIASFRLSKGETAAVPGNPAFTIQVLGVSPQYGVNLKITFPDGYWQEQAISTGEFFKTSTVDYDYGFSATVLDAASGLVQVDEMRVPDTTGASVFDPALAWQPHGTGLVLIRRTSKTQGVLYLIQPRGKGEQWQLVATAPIAIPPVKAIRFASPGLLLLQTGTYSSTPQFSEVPIHITNGSKGGKPTITLGTVTSLPDTATVTVKGASVGGPVLDWSCGDHHHRGEDHGDGDDRD